MARLSEHAQVLTTLLHAVSLEGREIEKSREYPL